MSLRAGATVLEASRLLRSAVQALSAGSFEAAKVDLSACLELASQASPGRARELILGHAFAQRALAAWHEGDLVSAQSDLRNGWSYARTTRDHALNRVLREVQARVQERDVDRQAIPAQSPAASQP